MKKLCLMFIVVFIFITALKVTSYGNWSYNESSSFAELTKTDIPFEGTVVYESHPYYDGHMSIRVEVSKGLLKGKTHTFYLSTNPQDTTKNINTTELGRAYGLETLKGFGWDLKVKGIVYEDICTFFKQEDLTGMSQDDNRPNQWEEKCFRIKEIHKLH